MVEQVVGLLSDGLARAWGVANWEAKDVAKATEVATAAGVPGPVAAQLRYGLSDWSMVDRPMVDALRQAGAGLIPSSVLAGGLLTREIAPTESASPKIRSERPSILGFGLVGVRGSSSDSGV